MPRTSSLMRVSSMPRSARRWSGFSRRRTSGKPRSCSTSSWTTTSRTTRTLPTARRGRGLASSIDVSDLDSPPRRPRRPNRKRARRLPSPFARQRRSAISTRSRVAVRALRPEAFLEMSAPFEVALLEDPRVAPARVGEDLPGVVVAVPEEKAVGAVALGGLLDVVQAPRLRLVGAQSPGFVDLGVGVDVESVVVAARHRLLVLGEDDRVHVVAAETDHQRNVARAHDFEAEEFLVEAARGLEILGAEGAVREKPCLERRCLHSLLQLDSGVADDLAPEPVVGAQALGRRFGRAAAGLRAELEEALADLGIVDGRLQVPIEEAADVGRRAPRSEHGEPCAHLPTRK